MINMSVSHICSQHKTNSKNAVSPCRGTCRRCKKKRVHGYENPDHVPNPFGYLYLIPSICLECAENTKTCMWCPLADNLS